MMTREDRGKGERVRNWTNSRRGIVRAEEGVMTRESEKVGPCIIATGVVTISAEGHEMSRDLTRTRFSG